jgi:hypothetical protein
MSLGVAFRSFFRALSDGGFSDRVKAILDSPAGAAPVIAPPEPPREIVREVVKEVPKAVPGESLRLLGVLQRDGRLLDFLNEDIAGYDDAQIGAAVRDIHRDCKKTLDKYVDLAPVLDKEEGSNVDVPAGFNPGEIRLTGNVKGQPPFKGSLAHRGWKAMEVRAPAPDPGNEMIIAPAEVELS